MRYSTISKIGSFTALSDTTPDYLLLDPSRCNGGADADPRNTIEDAPGADGVLIEPPLDGQHVITLAGDLIITSDGSDPGYFTAIDTLLASLKTALDGLKTSAGDLTHSGGTLKVWKFAKLETSWSGTIMSVTFAVVVDPFA